MAQTPRQPSNLKTAADSLARRGEHELLTEVADVAGVLGLGDAGRGINRALEARLRAELVEVVKELERRWWP